MDAVLTNHTEPGSCAVDGVAVADEPGVVVTNDIGITAGDWGPMGAWLNDVPDGSVVRMRFYLFDMPEGASMRILAIALTAPASTFERAVEAAAPVLDSIEFHAP
jgi:hypothetical protein